MCTSFQNKSEPVKFMPYYTLILKCYECEVKLKEYVCVQVRHNKNIGKTIEEWQKNGWSLHTYQARGFPTLVNHYLLLEKGE